MRSFAGRDRNASRMRAISAARLVKYGGLTAACVSAAARLRREERLSVDEEERVLELLGVLQRSWVEILPSEEVRDRAVRLLRVHGLKAADALQLAAAWGVAPGISPLRSLR